MLAYTFFCCPSVKKIMASLTSIVQSQIKNLIKGNYFKRSTPPVKKMSCNADITRAVADKLDEGDIKDAVRLASSDDTIVASTVENKALPVSKHTSSINRSPYPSTDTQQIEMSEQEVRKAVLAFASGSATPTPEGCHLSPHKRSR